MALLFFGERNALKSRLICGIKVLLFFSCTATAQWQDLSNPQLGDFFGCKFISAQNGWVSAVGGTQEGLLKTTDGGMTWSKILDHQPGTFNWIYSFDFLDDSVGYAASVRGQKCFRTFNGGRTWDTVNCAGNGGNAFGGMGSIRIRSLGLAFAGEGVEFFRSTDSLRTWQTISYLPQGGVFAPGFRFIFFCSDTIIAYGGTETLLGSEWTGTIECYKSTDGGFTWGFPFVDTLAIPYAGSFGSNRIGYTFTGIWHEPSPLDIHYKTHKTTDGGATWFQIPARLDSNGMLVRDAYFKNTMEGFVSGNALAHTSDGGITWMRIREVGDVVSMSWPDSLHGWVVGSNGRIYRTTTGGWLPIQLASFTGTHLGGTRVRLDWRTLSETDNYGFYLQRRREADTAFAGISPLIPGHGTTNEPHEYSFTDSNATINRWYYRLKQVDFNSSVHYTEPIIVDVTTDVPNGKAPFVFSLAQNFPNPFNPATQIAFSVPERGFVTLTVFDVLGKQVASLVNEAKEAGAYALSFEASHLSSGVYIYRLSAGTFTAARKMIFIR